MQAIRIETKIQKDGTLSIPDLPFSPGDPVEVIILEGSKPEESKAANGRSLRGTEIEYHDPFKPVAENDWEISN